MKIGISLIIFLPKITTVTAVSSETTAISQSVFAMSTAVEASDNPISRMMGPTTTDGKRRSTKVNPRNLTSAETTP